MPPIWWKKAARNFLNCKRCWDARFPARETINPLDLDENNKTKPG